MVSIDTEPIPFLRDSEESTLPTYHSALPHEEYPSDIFELAKQGAATPADLAYYFPAEFATSGSMWLSWPLRRVLGQARNQTFMRLLPYYQGSSQRPPNQISMFAKRSNESFAAHATWRRGGNLAQIRFQLFPTKYAWCRDHGPAFLKSILKRNQRRR